MANLRDKLVEICSECLCASCWHGEFLCIDSADAGTELKTVSELRKLGREHKSHWSDEKLNKFYGEPAPNGYQHNQISTTE